MDLRPHLRSFVEAQPVARLGTIDDAGRPHLVPICFVLLDGRCYSVVDEKPKRSMRLRRLRNIEASPVATLLCDVYSDDWGRLAWVMLRCRAEVIEGGDEHVTALAALREKYPQYRSMDLDGRPMIVLTPEHVSSWGLAERDA